MFTQPVYSVPKEDKVFKAIKAKRDRKAMFTVLAELLAEKEKKA